MAFRFLHCSDIHILKVAKLRVREFRNKRFLGGMNVLLKRGRGHDPKLFDKILAAAVTLGARLVITGDLTNLAFESEFAHVRGILDAADHPVTVIPGNHDAYVPKAAEGLRFEHYLAPYMTGDRMEDHYPFVQRHGKVALIGLSTAEPAPWFRATGSLGETQLMHLDGMLELLAEEGLIRVVLIHHSPLPGVASARRRLLDLEAFGEVIRRRGAELILHGHEHRVLEGHLPGPGETQVPVHGISSGTSTSRKDGKRAAFTQYRVAPDLLERELFVWDGEAFALV